MIIDICQYFVNAGNPKPCLLVAVGLRHFFFFRHAFWKKTCFGYFCHCVSIFGQYLTIFVNIYRCTYLPYSTQYRNIGRYVHWQILTTIDQISINIDKKWQFLSTTHIFEQKQCMSFFEEKKTLAASLKRSKHGLGTPKHAFFKSMRVLFQQKNIACGKPET